VEGWAGSFFGPVRLLWGRADPILECSLKAMQQMFSDAPVMERGAGHFLQEEVPEAPAEVILAVISQTDSCHAGREGGSPLPGNMPARRPATLA
jgi:pimeloyl-ACP methyl ester carboxylesterase